MTTSVGSVSFQVRLDTSAVAQGVSQLRNSLANQSATIRAQLDASQAISSANSLQSAVAAVGTSATNIGTGAVAGLGRGMQVATSSSTQLAQGIQAAASAASAISPEAINAFNQSVRNATNNTNQLGGAVSGIGDAANNSLPGAIVGLQSLADIAGSVFNTIKNVATDGVNTYKGFEASLNSFRAVANATPEQMAALEKEAVAIGAATTKTANQSAAAAVELAKLGFSADDTTKNLRGLVALAESTGTSVEKSASIVGAASSVYGRSAQDIANVVAATANATAADADDFLQAVSKAGAIAKSNNQDLETLATTFGLIRQSGFQAESAATALKTVINRLSAPGTKEAEEAMKKLGVTIRDSTTGEMRNLVELIPEFRTALGNLKPDERASITRTIFGDEGGPAFIALLSQTQQKIDSTYATIRKAAQGDTGAGAAVETQAKLMQGLNNASELLSGSVDTLKLNLGKGLAPALTASALAANAVLGAFLAAPAPIQTAVGLTLGLTAATTGLITGYVILEKLQIIKTAQEVAGAAATLSVTVATRGAAAAKAIYAVATTQVTVAMVANNATAAINAVRMAATAIATYNAGTAAWFTASAFKTMAISTAGVLAPMAALGAAIGVLEIVRKTQEIKGLNEALDDLRAKTEIAGQAGVNSADSLGKSQRTRSTAEKQGRGLSAGEKAAEKKALEQAQRTLPLLQQQLKEAEAVPKAQAGLLGIGKEAAESQNNARQAAINQIKMQIDQINRQKGAIEKSIDADKKKAEAQQKLLPTIDSVSKKVEEQTKLIDKQASQAQLKVEQDFASGKLNEEQAKQRRAEIEAKANRDKATINQKAVSDVATIKNADATKVTELKDKLEKDAVKSNIESAKSQQEAVKAQQKEAKRLQEEALKSQQEALGKEEDAIRQSVSQVQRAENEKLVALKQSLAQGAITKQQFDAQASQIRKSSAQTEIAQETSRIAKLKELASKGLIDKKKLAQEEAASSQKITGIKGQIADTVLQENTRKQQQKEQEVTRKKKLEEEAKAKNDKLLAQADRGFQVSQRGIQKDSSAAVLEARNSELGGASAEATAQKIDAIGQRQTQKEIALINQRLATTKKLQAGGVISAKEAADRKAQIEEELTNKTISLVERQIQAKRRAAVESIENNLARQKLPLEAKNFSLGLSSQNLELTAKKQSATSGVTEAQIKLDQQRLQYQLLFAELSGNSAKQEQLKETIYQQQLKSLAQSQEQKRADLGVSRQQQVIEFQRQEIAAKIAIFEAEATLAKAKATGASAREITALAQSLDFRRQAAAQIGRVRSAQFEINALEDKKLSIEQKTAREQITQARALEKQKELRQQILEKIENSIKAQERSSRLAVTNETLVVRKAELAGGLSTEDAAKQTEAIQIRTASREITIAQNKLSATRQLRAQGLISAKEAADREAQIQQDLAQANLSLIEKQIEAKRRAAVLAIENQLSDRKLQLEAQIGGLDAQKFTLDLESRQNAARVGVATVASELEKQRLEFQIAAAEASGNSVQAEAVKQQLYQQQLSALASQQQAAQQALIISQRQQAIELDRQKVQAQIALFESQAALEKGKATGASTREIASLEQVAKLREQAVSQVDSAQSAQQGINQLEQQKLALEQQGSRERLTQQKQLEDIRKAHQANNKEIEKGNKLNAEAAKVTSAGTWIDKAKPAWFENAKSVFDTPAQQPIANSTNATNTSVSGAKPTTNVPAEELAKQDKQTLYITAQTAIIQAMGAVQSQGLQGLGFAPTGVTKPDSPTTTKPDVENAKAAVSQAENALKTYIDKWNAEARANNEIAAKEYASRKGLNFNSFEGMNAAYTGSAEEAAKKGLQESVKARSQLGQNLGGKLQTFDGQAPMSELERLQKQLDDAKASLKNAQPQLPTIPAPDSKPVEQMQKSLELTSKEILAHLKNISAYLEKSAGSKVENLTVVSQNPVSECAEILGAISRRR